MDFIDSEMITRVVDNDYFKHQVQKQAEAHAGAFLSVRSKLAGAVATVLVTVLGAFGLTQYYSAAALSKRIDEVNKNASALASKLDQIDRLLQDAESARKAAHDLIVASGNNIAASQRVADSAAEAAMRTSSLTDGTRQYTSALLADVKRTQVDIDERNKDLRKNLEQASTLLNGLGDLPLVTAEIRKSADEVARRRDEVKGTSDSMIKSLETLQQNLNFEQEIAKAKTFEIVINRRGPGYATDITLPDFRNVDAKSRAPFAMHIVADGMSELARFRITVNKGTTQVFELKRGESARIAETPFRVRVDSIYHAKLAYDFVVLRIMPDDGGAVVPAPPAATTIARQTR